MTRTEKLVLLVTLYTAPVTNQKMDLWKEVTGKDTEITEDILFERIDEISRWYDADFNWDAADPVLIFKLANGNALGDDL